MKRNTYEAPTRRAHFWYRAKFAARRPVSHYSVLWGGLVGVLLVLVVAGIWLTVRQFGGIG